MILRRRRTAAALAALIVAAGGVTGCSTVSKLNVFKKDEPNKAVATQGERVSIIAFDQKVAQSETLKGVDFYLPPAAPIADWPLPGGTPEQAVEHVAAAKDFQIAWKKGFGEKSGRSAHVVATPIAAAGKVFVLDGEARVSALDAQTGERVWSVDLKPKSKRDRAGFGGGLAYADGKLYVASGFRFVAQLDAETGAEGWRTPVSNPIHAAPTVSGGRVFVADLNDELLTFDAASGQAGWSYQALSEPARILGASSPAVSGETVVVSFASGELVALRTVNGNDLWNEALSRASRTNALSEIRDIVGRPVIYKGDVLAVSHSGVFAATDLRTGQARWSLPVTGITSPWPAGDVVYVVSKAGEVICVNRENGQAYWITELNKAETKKQRKKAGKHPVIWSTPILASDRLIVTSSDGRAVAFNPKTGEILSTLKLGAGATVSPIAAGDKVYVVTEKAELIAIR